MHVHDRHNWQPQTPLTSGGEKRRVGVEIEFAGLSPDTVTGRLQALLGGDIQTRTRFDYRVVNTRLGDFALELDASYLKKLAQKQQAQGQNPHPLETLSTDLLTLAAELIVPWEIVAPPLAIEQLPELEPLIATLREAGALGTRHALQFAFGLHLNPELPDLNAATILRYLRAYICLHDWMVAREHTDMARRLTPFIKHYDTAYIECVMDPHYTPDSARLIDDYLAHNPTRNRSLDMLPLFAHLDRARVFAAIDDPRIKSRPTFHFRLPNCDIDNPRWSLFSAWRLWLAVERLAGDSTQLARLGENYLKARQRLTHPFDGHWVKQVEHWLERES